MHAKCLILVKVLARMKTFVQDLMNILLASTLIITDGMNILFRQNPVIQWCNTFSTLTDICNIPSGHALMRDFFLLCTGWFFSAQICIPSCCSLVWQTLQFSVVIYHLTKIQEITLLLLINHLLNLTKEQLTTRVSEDIKFKVISMYTCKPVVIDLVHYCHLGFRRHQRWLIPKSNIFAANWL